MALEELGFTAATRALVQRLEWRGVEVSLDLAGADALSETQRTVAFRIVQEAVANILRHAERPPGHDRIARRGDAATSCSRCSDDGHGFDPDHDIRRIDDGHLGLAAVAGARGPDRRAGEHRLGRGPGTTLRLVLPAPAP